VTQTSDTETNNVPTITVPFITAPTDTISQESAKQMVLQSGTDLQEARKLRQMQVAVVQASTMANNGASTEEVSSVLSNAGVMSNNYLNINEVVANPVSGETLLTATELARRVRDGTSATVDSNQAKADSLEQQVISRYQELLKSDPTNFWANYDMATITRNRGDSSAAYMYYLKAAEGISNPETAKAFKEQAAVKTKQAFKLTEVPTPAKSSFVSQLGSDASAWINDKGTKLFQKLLTPDQAKVILCIVNSDVNANLLNIATG
jgi:hypothetical protein